MSRTLSVYFGRQFLLATLGVYGALLAVVFLLDLAELMRRAAGKAEASFGVVFSLAALHLPTLGAEALPFAALFGGIFALVRLTRSHELAVARAVGVSAWQFLAPGAIVALGLGVIEVTAVNPLAALMLAEHERGVARYLDLRSQLVTISSTGLWLREADADGNHAVLHAASLDPSTLTLSAVTVLRFRGEDEFVGRVDADRAVLVEGAWRLQSAWLTGPAKPGERIELLTIPTVLTPEYLRETFVSPDTVGFWQLPRFIAVLEATGLSSLGHRMHWNSLLVRPFLLVAMVLIAAAVSLRLTRLGGVTPLVLAGIGIGLGFYLFVRVVEALGLGQQLPVVLAAWAPAGIALMFGLALLMHLEDG